jgi:hypothetical protein
LLDRRLVDLATHATFQVTINSVVGADADGSDAAYRIAVRARALGFTSTVGVTHDHAGQLQRFTPGQRDLVARILALAPSFFSFTQFAHFQRNIIRGLPNDWHCPAGGRFLYVCEDGLVHDCSQQRGTPGVPLETYSAADLAREADRPKPCASFCTVSCVHQVALLDGFRDRPRETLDALIAERRAHDAGFQPPGFVRMLAWAFIDHGHRP